MSTREIMGRLGCKCLVTAIIAGLTGLAGQAAATPAAETFDVDPMLREIAWAAAFTTLRNQAQASFGGAPGQNVFNAALKLVDRLQNVEVTPTASRLPADPAAPALTLSGTLPARQGRSGMLPAHYVQIRVQALPEQDPKSPTRSVGALCIYQVPLEAGFNRVKRTIDEATYRLDGQRVVFALEQGRQPTYFTETRIFQPARGLDVQKQSHVTIQPNGALKIELRNNGQVLGAKVIPARAKR